MKIGMKYKVLLSQLGGDDLVYTVTGSAKNLNRSTNEIDELLYIESQPAEGDGGMDTRFIERKLFDRLCKLDIIKEE